MKTAVEFKEKLPQQHFFLLTSICSWYC